jgi:hypothetical protein
MQHAGDWEKECAERQASEGPAEQLARAHYQRSAVYRERTPWDELPLAYRLNRILEMRDALRDSARGS